MGIDALRVTAAFTAEYLGPVSTIVLRRRNRLTLASFPSFVFACYLAGSNGFQEWIFALMSARLPSRTPALISDSQAVIADGVREAGLSGVVFCRTDWSLTTIGLTSPASNRL